MRFRLAIFHAAAILGLSVGLTGCATGPQARPEPGRPETVAPVPPYDARLAIPRVQRMAYPAFRAPSAVLHAFLESPGAANDPATAALLSTQTRSAYHVAELRQHYGGWLSYRLVLEEQLSADWAVVAIAGERERGHMAVLAVPAVRENGAWRLHLTAAPARAAPPIPARAGQTIALTLLNAERSGGANPAPHAWFDDTALVAHAARNQVRVTIPVSAAAGLHPLVLAVPNRHGVPWLHAYLLTVSP